MYTNPSDLSHLASYVVNQAALGSMGKDLWAGGFDCSATLCSYSSSGSLPQNANINYYSSAHCCVCSGACWHTGVPTYCPTHDPNQQTTAPPPQLIPLPYTPTLPYIPPATGIGINTNNWIIQQGSGGSQTFPSFTIEPEKCYICKDELSAKEVADEDKVCTACRTAVETFKQVLVEETPDKHKKRKRKK